MRTTRSRGSHLRAFSSHCRRYAAGRSGSAVPGRRVREGADDQFRARKSRESFNPRILEGWRAARSGTVKTLSRGLERASKRAERAPDGLDFFGVLSQAAPREDHHAGGGRARSVVEHGLDLSKRHRLPQSEICTIGQMRGFSSGRSRPDTGRARRPAARSTPDRRRGRSARGTAWAEDVDEGGLRPQVDRQLLSRAPPKSSSLHGLWNVPSSARGRVASRIAELADPVGEHVHAPPGPLPAVGR